MIRSAMAAAIRLVSGAAAQWRCDPRADVQRIYFANHSSHLDFAVIWASLPPTQRRLARPVAGRDYWERGVIRRLLARTLFDAVLIERGQAAPASARQAIHDMAEAMGERSSLIVFPEGTRSVTGEIGAFKSGLYHLSQARPDAELVPVLLENLNRLLPKGAVIPVPVLSRVVFGEPLAARRDEDKASFLARARAAILDLAAEP